MCVYVKCFSVLCSSTAVISAHPIHSLDPPHHHFHSGSLASPTRSFLHHQLSPWPLGSAMSHSDRADSTGERTTLRELLLCGTWKLEPEAGSGSSLGFHEAWVKYRQNPGWAGLSWVSQILILDVRGVVALEKGVSCFMHCSKQGFLLLKPRTLESAVSD